MHEEVANFHGLTRSQLMARIKSKGNKKTELKLLQIFRSAKVTGWRRHQQLPGRPDFVFYASRLAIFVDGCYWHGCSKHFRLPCQNTEFWKAKITANKNRDSRVKAQLREKGWTVLRIWEHELKQPERVLNRVQTLLSRNLS